MEQKYSNMDISFGIMVGASTNFWPLNLPKDSFIIPTDIQLMYNHFQKY